MSLSIKNKGKEKDNKGREGWGWFIKFLSLRSVVSANFFFGTRRCLTGPYGVVVVTEPREGTGTSSPGERSVQGPSSGRGTVTVLLSSESFSVSVFVLFRTLEDPVKPDTWCLDSYRVGNETIPSRPCKVLYVNRVREFPTRRGS